MKENEVAACDFNREPIHYRGGKSAEEFNLRNITFKLEINDKQNFATTLKGKQNPHKTKIKWVGR